MGKELKEIRCYFGAQRKLVKETGASVTTVRYALRGATNTELSAKIREIAMKKYGGTYV